MAWQLPSIVGSVISPLELGTRFAAEPAQAVRCMPGRPAPTPLQTSSDKINQQRQNRLQLTDHLSI
jgi:hypothetical protein